MSEMLDRWTKGKNGWYSRMVYMIYSEYVLQRFCDNKQPAPTRIAIIVYAGLEGYMSRSLINFCEKRGCREVFLCVEIDKIAVHALGRSCLVSIDMCYLEGFDATVTVYQLHPHPGIKQGKILTAEIDMCQETHVPKEARHPELRHRIIHA